MFFDQLIQAILSTGEPTTFPSEILTFLHQRRLQARQLGSWVEGHYRLGNALGADDILGVVFATIWLRIRHELA